MYRDCETGRPRVLSQLDRLLRVLTLVLPLLAGPPAYALELRSSDVANGQIVPRAQIYPRCGGDNISPELTWSGAPRRTKSFVLTMIDVDVKPSDWSHWIVADIPAGTRSLSRGTKTLPRGARAIESNFGGTAYNGPCPPSGTHHYRLTLWALPVSNVLLAPNEKATDVIATLTKLALDRASLTAFVRHRS